MNIQTIPGGVTAAQGYQAAGIAAGIKKSGSKDMALIYSQTPCVCAGTFTTNVVKAAPVVWDQAVVKSGNPVHAIVCNSGVANACTGTEGFSYCGETAKKAGEVLQIEAENVLVTSTGVIGKQLPMERITQGIADMVPLLSDTAAAADEAAHAILTTDTRKKEIAVEIELSGKKVVIGGMCKGSGMIHPNMCTMLSFVTTDAAISAEMLQAALSADVQDTYNMISVDGDTSTNDTVLLLANGLAGNVKIETQGTDYEIFAAALAYVNTYLAKAIAGDGEGCTALFEVQVVGAQSKEQAVLLSKSVITSNLTKTAIFGHDANWGRILCAMGYAGAEFDPEQVDLFFESEGHRLQIIKDGVATEYSEEEATEILSKPVVTAIADLKMGEAKATAWGCDLTYEYVRINGDYRS
ncbi:MAG: bifunctional glutamate N-acetyltransferase/amino-acid acetyltransferase ArgJ [Lachnospiraceae bacterium]